MSWRATVLPNAVLSDLQINIRVLKPDGWAVEGSVHLQMPESGLSMREVMGVVLDAERQRRLAVPPALENKASLLLQALNTGGTRTPEEGQLRRPPPLSELLFRVEQALHDGLILVILNSEPWKKWTEPCLLPNPSSLWVARTVWLQHHAWG